MYFRVFFQKQPFSGCGRTRGFLRLSRDLCSFPAKSLYNPHQLLSKSQCESNNLKLIFIIPLPLWMWRVGSLARDQLSQAQPMDQSVWRLATHVLHQHNHAGEMPGPHQMRSG